MSCASPRRNAVQTRQEPVSARSAKLRNHRATPRGRTSAPLCCGVVRPDLPDARAIESGSAIHTDLRVTELLVDHSALRGAVGGRSRFESGWCKNLPVVIVPGVCSSGLMVRKSTVCPSWEGERVWFSLAKLSQNIGRHSGHSSIPEGQSANKDALVVTVHRASLLQSDGNSSAHRLFAQLELIRSDGQRLPGVRKSRALQESTLQPEWEQEIVLGSECELDEAKYLRVRVFDKEMTGKGTLGVVDVALNAEWQCTSRDTRPHDGQDFDLYNLCTFVPYATGSSRRSRTKAGLELRGQIVLSLDFRPARHGPNSPVARRGSSRVNFVERQNNGDDRHVSSTALGVAVEEARVMAGKALGMMHGGAAGLAGHCMSHADYLAAAQLKQVDKSMWLRHVLLDTDSESDPPGIEVRNVEGLAGVDYLEASNRVLAATTWVFGKTIEYLKKRGYDETNLKAVPYDWRLPPQVLEGRDKFFTRWVQLIETTSEDNGGKPVVLLAHSMGNKMCHYFLNWVVINAKTYNLMGGNGRAWLHRYVHSFFAVAGPFLGSCAAFRTALTGRDIGLGAFLTHDEHLLLNRNYGSTPWLMPTNALAHSMPVNVVNVRKMCTVTIEIVNVKIVGEACVEEGWVRVEYTNAPRKRRATTRTKLVSPVDEDGRVLEFGQRFQFVTPDSLREPTGDTIRISLRGKSWLKDAKHAFRRRRLTASDRTRTSAGLFADNSSPLLGLVELTPSELFGAVKANRKKANIAAAGQRVMPSNLSYRRLQADLCEPHRLEADLPDLTSISAQGVVIVTRLQASFRGYRLRKLQWVASNWLVRRQMDDGRTRFWIRHHRARARAHMWPAIAQGVSITNAAFALHEAGIIHNKIQDLQEHTHVFSGHDAVEVLRKWLFENNQSSQAEDAELLCDGMLRAGFFHAVNAQIHFDNGHTLYRFFDTSREFTGCIGFSDRAGSAASSTVCSVGRVQRNVGSELKEALQDRHLARVNENLVPGLVDPPPLCSALRVKPPVQHKPTCPSTILNTESGTGQPTTSRAVSVEDHLGSSDDCENRLRRRHSLKRQLQVAVPRVAEMGNAGGLTPPPLPIPSKHAPFEPEPQLERERELELEPEPEPDSPRRVRSPDLPDIPTVDNYLQYPVGVDESTIQLEKTLELTYDGCVVAEVFVRCMFEFGGSLTQDLGGGRLFERRDMRQTLRRFGASHVTDKWDARYLNDPCLPDGTTSDPPPCERVFHVYGTHLDTEVAYAYTRKDGCEVTLAGPKSASLELDSELDKVFSDSNYKCKGGIIFETKQTNQSAVMPIETDRQLRDTRGRAEVIASGDGTVPYLSLRHSITWNDRNGVQAENVELKGVEHREILRSKEFHSVAGQYLCETLVVYRLR